MRRTILIILIIVVIWVVLFWLWALVTSIGCDRKCLRDGRRIPDIHQIQLALDFYFKRCGVYPGGVPNPGSDPACASVSRPRQLASIYGQNIPNDPQTEDEYSYCY